MEYPVFNISERTNMNHEKALKYFKECVIFFHKDFCDHDITEKEFLKIDESIKFFEQLRKICKSEVSKVKVVNGCLRAKVDMGASGKIYLSLSIKYTD